MSGGVPLPDYRREAEPWSLAREHAQLTATTTVKLYKVPSGRKLRIQRVLYINVTGLAADGSNYFTLALKNGATTISTVFNTNTSGGAAVAANTFSEGVPSATDGDLVLNEGDELSAVFTRTGTPTLPAGFYRFEGRLVAA